MEEFEAAAGWFLGLVGRVREWDAPGLGEWSVRELIGHTGRALSTVEAYLDRPAAAATVPSGVDYFLALLPGDAAAVAERGREAAAALGDDPVTATAALVGRVLARVRAASPEDLVTTPAGGMRLADYLPTRTMELVVHGCDLARALGLPPDPPAGAAAAAGALVTGIAAATGRAGPLLLAATGRGPLPPGYTVL